VTSNKIYFRCDSNLTGWIKSNGFIEINPAIGPNARTTNIKDISIIPASWLTTQILTIVIAKPILFTKVKAEPTKSLGAERAMIAEYCGESPTTTIPQKIRKVKNIGTVV